MSRLEELLQTLCPDGVEYTKLGEIAYIDSSGVDKKIINNQKKVMLLNYMDVYRNRLINRSVLNMEVTASDNKIVACDIQKGDIFITPTSETIEDLAHSAVITETIEGAVYSYHVMRIRLKTFSMTTSFFLNYLFRSIFVQEQILKNATGLTRFGLSREKWKSLKVPFPPLPVQEEIVRILDTFTALETELEKQLEAELAARTKQYEHYHDTLFRNLVDQGIEELSLGEICTDMYRGAGIKRDQVTEHGTPCVRYGEIYTTYSTSFYKCVSHTNANDIQNKKYFGHGDILFAITGENIEEIAKSTVYLGHDRCLAGGDIVVMKHKQNPKYVAYALSTKNAQDQKSKGRVKSKVVHSSALALKQIKIPIPSIEVQEQIVSILDRFDALVNDLKNGLPAEIALRRKQYEYYRNKLLTFKPIQPSL